MEEDANLTISDSNRGLSGDEVEGMCKYAEYGDVPDAFFVNSGSECTINSVPGMNKG